jgi:hypothetical protein
MWANDNDILFEIFFEKLLDGKWQGIILHKI